MTIITTVIEHVKILTKVSEHVKIITTVNENVKIIKKVNKHVKIITTVNEYVKIITKVNEHVKITRKSCSETNTKAALSYRSTTILKLWYNYDGYVKYEEAEIHRSAIMQDFLNSGKKKMAD